MEKLNIAEILKDCPKGMELDCAIYENVEFDYVEQSPESKYPIHCLMKTNDGYNTMVFTNNGCYDRHPNAKCVIFPKGKTTWEGFQRPFKDGDVVFYDDNIAIFKEWGDSTLFRTYVKLYIHRTSIDKGFPLFGKGIRRAARLATEEEKQKLFDAIKANGYKWNAETKTLEKLIEPKFKVGDKVKNKDGYVIDIIEIDTNKEEFKYKTPIGAIGEISFNNQNNYELVPNKFDITTLEPFDRVLVRDNNEQKWTIDMFSFYDKTLIYPFSCIGHYVNQCIPYEGNELLLGTNNDCDNYYKTWK